MVVDAGQLLKSNEKNARQMYFCGPLNSFEKMFSPSLSKSLLSEYVWSSKSEDNVNGPGHREQKKLWFMASTSVGQQMLVKSCLDVRLARWG